jgi:RNA-directed DNA polymerase
MTAVLTAGATPCRSVHWDNIDWPTAHAEVYRLQMRIAKAAACKDWGKVKSLQWIVTHSFFARVLAVKRVCSNKGARTPGVDGVVWKTPAQKMRGAMQLKRKGYRAMPLRRKMIKKKNGKHRALGIPTIRDRAMQMLYLLALEPVAEVLADPNSYGFRPYRSCRDAISQCFVTLGKSASPKWILEADIKSCFDQIDHQWLLTHIPTDRKVLSQWLKCGFVHNRKMYPTEAGSPQGGIISPTLANMTLNGLEQVVKLSHPKRLPGLRFKRSGINCIRYADDFIVTAARREILEDNVLPALNAFLESRGLVLSPEKTRIVHIDEGFDFLGQNVRKYKGKLLIRPSKDSVKSFKDKIRQAFKAARGQAANVLIQLLNPKISGWTHYHRCIPSAKTFSILDSFLWIASWKWARKRHDNKSRFWVAKRYFQFPKAKWRLSCYSESAKGTTKVLSLRRIWDTALVKYTKIKADANPFDPRYKKYFIMRRKSSNTKPFPASIKPPVFRETKA